MNNRFPIRLGPRSRPLLLLFGVRSAADAYVELGDDEVHARFGFAAVRTPIRNVVRYRIEGPWLWVTAIGIRLSIRHRDLTLTGSPHGGVRMDFAERVPYGIFRLPALYVGADDLEGFAAALAARGIPGIDARKRKVG
ncbi:MAG: hypothetical protein ACJ77N_11360 [Chloroflexota bacterium]|jgi:hypothetical protein